MDVTKLMMDKQRLITHTSKQWCCRNIIEHSLINIKFTEGPNRVNIRMSRLMPGDDAPQTVLKPRVGLHYVDVFHITVDDLSPALYIESADGTYVNAGMAEAYADEINMLKKWAL